MDEWEELDDVPKKKPYTFDDRVDDYRRGIKKALKNTEKKEEIEDEVDLVFAEVINESAKETSDDCFSQERFTPMCTPKKNRRDLLSEFTSFSEFLKNHKFCIVDCDEGEWDSDWDEENKDDHPSIRGENTLNYV